MRKRRELSKEDRRMGLAEDGPPRGCNWGCLLLILACIAVDACFAWVACQAARGIAWLLSLMAYA